jgi:CheY-like chemotaxis protein
MQVTNTMSSAGDQTLGHRSKSRVLIVDDDWSVVKLVETHLSDEGFETLSASNVGEAWRLLKAEAPDLVIVDIRLPGPFGWELIDRIKKDLRFHRIPVLVMSAFFETADIERAGSMDCETLEKPFLGHHLLSKVKGCLTLVRRIQLARVQSMLLLDTYVIRGVIHVSPELSRFSDAWESVMADGRLFLPVTEASITTIDGQPLASPLFMQVMKSQLRGVFPLEPLSGTAIEDLEDG